MKLCVKYIIYWTADMKSNELWSMQLWMQFLQFRIEACKFQDNNIADRSLNFSGFYTQLQKLHS